MRYLIRIILITGLLMSAPLFAHAVEEAAPNADPWESMNRKVFSFNERLDRWLLTPLARGYQAVTPGFVDRGLTNAFENLFIVRQLVNDVLQGKFGQLGIDTGRFLINTTVGVVGFIDVAGQIGLEKQTEDFSQTFAVWGIGSGPYVVLPFFGPSTVRDALTMPLNSASYALNYIEHIPTRNTALGVDFVDVRADLIAAENLITGDRYTFLRNAFLQNREYLIKDGNVVVDTFGDEDFDDW